MSEELRAIWAEVEDIAARLSRLIENEERPAPAQPASTAHLARVLLVRLRRTPDVVLSRDTVRDLRVLAGLPPGDGILGNTTLREPEWEGGGG